jgi:hypothetical protein
VTVEPITGYHANIKLYCARYDPTMSVHRKLLICLIFFIYQTRFEHVMIRSEAKINPSMFLADPNSCLPKKGKYTSYACF